MLKYMKHIFMCLVSSEYRLFRSYHILNIWFTGVEYNWKEVAERYNKFKGK